MENKISKILAIIILISSFAIPLIRDFLIADWKNPKEIILIISTYLLIYFIMDRIESWYHCYLIKKNHYPKSFNVVINSILPTFHENSKSSGNHNIEYNKTIDKLIKSPIDYTNETLTGNQAPSFNPNERYLEEIYDENINHIVAITAENPNLWMDPTLCFYMINCCAVSLIQKFNRDLRPGKKIVTRDFNDDRTYQEFVNSESKDLLLKLKNKEEFTDFEFVRFLLFDEEQKDCLEQTVFPSLKASQDLFRIKSFFIQNNNIQNNLRNEYPLYLSVIDDIWDRIRSFHGFTDVKIINIINKRKEKHIPEFLILFKEHNEIIVHTYLNGEAYSTPFENGINEVNNDASTIKNLIAYLANCRIKNTKCDWIPTMSKLNSKKSYMDWEISQ